MSRPAAFSAAQSRRLGTFLTHPARPPGTMTYPELCGFLFAITTSPELVQPSEWLPLIFGDQDAGYADLAEAREILGLLMSLYNVVNAQVLAAPARTPVLPAGCTWRKPPLRNLDDDAPLHHWARGFTAGYQWLEEDWNHYLPDPEAGQEAGQDADQDAGSEQFGAVLVTLGFFASRAFADAVLQDLARGETTLAKFAGLVVQDFPGALGYLACLARGPRPR